MDSFKCREADELVSALQKDVERTILNLRGDGERENDIGVPVCFSEMPIIDRVELEGNNLVFYSRGNRNKIKGIMDDYVEMRIAINEVIDEWCRSVMMEEMKRIGMIK